MAATTTNEFSAAASAVADAARVLSADAIRQAAEGVEAVNTEALAAFDAISGAAGMKTFEEAAQAGCQYWEASFERMAQRAKAVTEAFPSRMAAVSEPAGKAASALQAAFSAR